MKIDDIAPSLCFAPPKPPRSSDERLQMRNVLAPNDNYAVSVMPVGGRALLLSDMPGSIEVHTDTLIFEKANKAGPMGGFHDNPALPLGMLGSFGAAHPLYTGSSLDASGSLYGILNVQRLTTADSRQACLPACLQFSCITTYSITVQSEDVHDQVMVIGRRRSGCSISRAPTPPPPSPIRGSPGVK